MTDDFAIPSFWSPAAVKSGILTPLMFLRVQAAKLGEETRGVLLGEVSTTTGENFEVAHSVDDKLEVIVAPVRRNDVTHSLNVIAPALNNYRHRFVVVYHKADMVYPARLETMDGIFEAATEEEFQELLRKTLSSPAVISVMQSLIARSNEADMNSAALPEQQAADRGVPEATGAPFTGS